MSTKHGWRPTHARLSQKKTCRNNAAAGLKFPIIFMTGDGEAAIERQAVAAGGIAFLRKPFLATTLIDAIKNFHGKAATTMTSTSIPGRQKSVVRPARTGRFAGSTHSFQTEL